jgi:hypothetical protein
MKKIKKYQEFTNEEINFKKALAGAALGASLLTTPSCDQQPVKNNVEYSDNINSSRVFDYVTVDILTGDGSNKNIEYRISNDFKQMFGKSRYTDLVYLIKSGLEDAKIKLKNTETFDMSFSSSHHVSIEEEKNEVVVYTEIIGMNSLGVEKGLFVVIKSDYDFILKEVEMFDN